MVMQQYLIPHRTGDERLLIPGWAGELTDPELAFIEERLRGSRRLIQAMGDHQPGLRRTMHTPSGLGRYYRV